MINTGLSLGELMRIRSEIHGPQALWSAEAVGVMSEAREMCRLEDDLLQRLNGASPIAIYALHIDERLKRIEERLAALESLADEEEPS